MPLYEYFCTRCGNRFEKLGHHGATPLCPGCGESDVRKLFSTFSVGRPQSPFGSAQAAGPEDCGSCGDPRGPGACAIDG